MVKQAKSFAALEVRIVDLFGVFQCLDWDTQGHFQDAENILFLQLSVGYTGVFVCENSLHGYT